VDILVKNAGVQQVAPIEQFPPERFGHILRLMLESPFRLIRQTLPYMYGRGWGRVVNISSVHGLRASPFKAAYVRTPLVTAQLADQAATHGLTEAEVLDKVLLEPVAVKRLIEPAEVAELVALLCGPASASITGSSFVLDGGRRLELQSGR
jgi:3-hydroxybutyrate dehydrogenase